MVSISPLKLKELVSEQFNGLLFWVSLLSQAVLGHTLAQRRATSHGAGPASNQCLTLSGISFSLFTNVNDPATDKSNWNYPANNTRSSSGDITLGHRRRH